MFTISLDYLSDIGVKRANLDQWYNCILVCVIEVIYKINLRPKKKNIYLNLKKSGKIFWSSVLKSWTN